MLQTAEAEISVDGSVRLLEPLQVRKTSRVLVVLKAPGRLLMKSKRRLWTRENHGSKFLCAYISIHVL